MLKLTVVLALLAVCFAQEPPKKPDIPESFMAMLTIHINERDEHIMAPGTWERNFDEEKGMAKETAKFNIRNSTSEDERIERFDMKMAYDVHMNSSGTFCMEHDLPVMMPKIWDWVNSDKAHGDRHKDPRTGEMVDRWSIATERGIVMLFVDDMNVNVPLALVTMERGREEDVRFDKFEPTTPPESDFVKPAACN